MKLKKLIVCAILSCVAAQAYAIQSTQTINLSATINDPDSVFQVVPVASWPTSTQSITWNESNKQFTNPNSIAFRVKSSEDVTVSLSSNAKLVSGSAEIPVKVSVTAADTTKGTSAPDLTLTPVAIYEKSKNSAGDFASFTLAMEAQKTGWKDAAGVVIPVTGSPSPGSYTGAVDLVFESNI